MNSNPLPNQFALNRDSPIPLYHQLLEIFHEFLANGTWKAGDWIPPESELAKSYEVSEITVRQALLTLTREGRLVRKRGKGTHVAEMVQDSPVVELNHLREPFWEFDTMQVQLLETGFASEKNVPPNPLGKKEVFYIRRLCSQNERPVIFQTMFIHQSVAQQVQLSNWTNPKMGLVLAPLFHDLACSKELVEAISLGRYEASVLDEQEGRTALLFERTLSERDHPVFFERIIARFGSLTFISEFNSE